MHEELKGLIVPVLTPFKASGAIDEHAFIRHLEFLAHHGVRRMGELKDVAAEYPDVVQQLRTEAIEEIDRRGADPAIVHWLKAEGAVKFPDSAYFGDNWPGPTAFTQYFFRLYEGE